MFCHANICFEFHYIFLASLHFLPRMTEDELCIYWDIDLGRSMSCLLHYATAHTVYLIVFVQDLITFAFCNNLQDLLVISRRVACRLTLNCLTLNCLCSMFCKYMQALKIKSTGFEHVAEYFFYGYDFTSSAKEDLLDHLGVD